MVLMKSHFAIKRIADNGQGIKAEINKSKSFGNSLNKSLSQRLNAEVKVSKDKLQYQRV